MNVIAFNGSARKDGNTAILINHVLDELQKEGIATELIQLAGTNIHGCRACMKCSENLDKHCVTKDDIVNDCIKKMIEADGIILGSPTYFTDVSAEMKALIDRAGYVAKANGSLFRRKVGAAVVAMRRAGSFFISEMIVAGSSYWNVGIGREKDAVNSDEEGILTMKVLGKNMAWLLKKIHA